MANRCKTSSSFRIALWKNKKIKIGESSLEHFKPPLRVEEESTLFAVAELESNATPPPPSNGVDISGRYEWASVKILFMSLLRFPLLCVHFFSLWYGWLQWDRVWERESIYFLSLKCNVNVNVNVNGLVGDKRRWRKEKMCLVLVTKPIRKRERERERPY